MKRLLLPLALLLVPFLAHAQQRDLATALQYLEANRSTYQLTSEDLSGAVVTARYTDDHNGVTHLYLTQRHNGIEVYEGVLSVHLKGDQVVYVSNRFESKLAARVNTASPSLSVQAAVENVAFDLALPISEPLVMTASKGGPAQEMTLSTAGISLEPIPARLVYVPQDNGSVRLAWHVEIYELDQQHYWRALVDARSGETLVQQDLVVHDDFGFTPVVTDTPNWRTNEEVRELLRAKYAAEKAAYQPASSGQGAGMPTSDGQYEVYPIPDESPVHAGEAPLGPATQRDVVSEASLISQAGPRAATNGWHDDGTSVYTTTRGNNVWAYLDSLGTEAGPSPDDGVSRNFTTSNTSLLVNYDLDFSDQPTAYGHAAAVNLFYMNNIMHDVFYQYGFDEQSGNMQQTNFGRGGLGSDGVLAQAQDGGGQNNANQLTLQDGVPPRMQMFLWTPPGGQSPVEINSPAGIAGVKNSLPAAFGPRPMGETADLVLAVANTGLGAAGSPDEGCGLNAGAAPSPLAYANAAQMNGKIAFIKRGTCSFAEKVLSAQLSGAIGAIIYTQNPGEGPIVMGCTAGCEGVTIPSAMVGNTDGLTIRAVIDASTTVNATLREDPNFVPFRDGDFDNGIIAHEYHHSVSTRLVAGPANACLGGNEQGGEGWSDWAALMLTMKAGDTRTTAKGIGNYSTFQDPFTGGGIRPAPYSTDFATNPFLYSDLQNAGGSLSIPHGVGFLWATMMWELVWDLVDRDGFDPDVYSGNGGNNLAMQLIVDGMKMTPCSPTFIDMRDGIVAAAVAAGGQDECVVWNAFARRGLGYSAQAGVYEDHFDLPPQCAPQLRLAKKVDKATTVAGDVLTYTLSATNEFANALTNVQLTDTLPERTSYVAGSAESNCNGTFDGTTVTFDPGTIIAGATRNCTFQVAIDGGVHSPVLFTDDMENGGVNWTSTSDVPGVQWVYEPASSGAHSPFAAWFAQDFATDNNQYLTLNTAIALPAEDNGNPIGSTGTPMLTFWHKFQTELGFDGGYVEISTDGGANWSDLGPKMTKNGYNGSFFNGDSCTFPDADANCHIQTEVDLTSFAGQSVLIRFRMFTDLLVPEVGWWVDDVEFVDAGCVINTASASASEFAGPSTDDARTCVTNTEPLITSVDARIFIEGPYDEGSDRMLTTLNGRGDLPTDQPYSDPAFDGTPMDYDGSESVDASFFVNHPTIVDWVLLELRTGTDAASTVARRAVFLKNDGSLVDLDGTSLPAFTTAPGGALYVVVRHRNHLPVMSANALSPSGSTLTQDFTTGQGQAFGTQPMKQLESGVYGLYGGDADADGQIQNDDKNVNWRNEVGLAGYRSADFNLNGQVQTSDKNVVWRPNVGLGSQID